MVWRTCNSSDIAVRTVRRWPAALLLAALLALPAPRARANNPVLAIAAGGAALLAHDLLRHPRLEHRPSSVALSVNGFDIVQFARPAVGGGVQYRWGQPLLWRLRPFVGLGVTGDGAGYGYAGLRLTQPFGRHWFAGVDVGAALYARGGGKDLGSAALARSGLSLGYRFGNGADVELQFHHMSHAHLFSNHNPGVEIASLTLDWPLS